MDARTPRTTGRMDDGAKEICRHWQEHRCSKATGCRFLHEGAGGLQRQRRPVDDRVRWDDRSGRRDVRGRSEERESQTRDRSRSQSAARKEKAGRTPGPGGGKKPRSDSQGRGSQGRGSKGRESE
jgi:hypothetical protein